MHELRRNFRSVLHGAIVGEDMAIPAFEAYEPHEVSVTEVWEMVFAKSFLSFGSKSKIRVPRSLTIFFQKAVNFCIFAL